MSTSQEPHALAPQEPMLVFFSYSHKDKLLRNRLDEHLSNLKYRGLITTWYDQEIKGGEEWAQHIHANLDKAKIILLLVSPSFMSSGYCYGIEMQRALERHEKKEAEVIPILLRAVHYADAPFAKLQFLPTNARPIALWRDRDSAFLEIAYGIEKVALNYSAKEAGLQSPGFAMEANVRTTLRPRDFGVAFDHSTIDLMQDPRAIRRPALLIALIIAIALMGGGVYLLQRLNLLSLALRILGYGLAILIGIAIVVNLPRLFNFVRDLTTRKESLTDWRKETYYKQALSAYVDAFSSNPSDGYTYQGLGNAYYALENYKAALICFNKAIVHAPTASTYAALANTYAKLRRYYKAIEAFEQAIELDPEMNFNNDEYPIALQALGRTQEAQQVLAQIQAQYGDE